MISRHILQRYLDTPPLIFFQVMVNHVTSYTYPFLLPVSYIYFMKLVITSCSGNYLQRCSQDFFTQTLSRAALKAAGGNCRKSFNVTTKNTFKTAILQNSSSIMQKCLSQNRCYFLVTFVLRFDLFALSPTNYQQTIFNVKALFCSSTRLYV